MPKSLWVFCWCIDRWFPVAGNIKRQLSVVLIGALNMCTWMRVMNEVMLRSWQEEGLLKKVLVVIDIQILSIRDLSSDQLEQLKSANKYHFNYRHIIQTLNDYSTKNKIMEIIIHTQFYYRNRSFKIIERFGGFVGNVNLY